jgi:fructuronate reductase
VAAFGVQVTERLSSTSLAAIDRAVKRPLYDRAELQIGLVHLGVGAFHRAHQAVMTEAAIDAGDLHWGIVAASLRSPEMRDALIPQDGLYTVAVRGDGGERLQVIGALKDIIVAPEEPQRLIDVMSQSSVKVVTLTVTEKGYCHDPATGTLNESHPDIIHDLASIERPRSAPGFLVAALRRRRAMGIPPFTILCCDNLPTNGRTVKRVVVRLAALIEPDLGRFVEEQVACPCTMVDRIVPATTDDERKAVSNALGVLDAWPVTTEPFSQWVIEDDFPTGRPRWEVGGAQFTTDVAPFELMKLRMLNGAHSALAYLGLLAGHAHVSDAATDPEFVRYLDVLWSEIAPSLPQQAGLDPTAYGRTLLTRFRNPALRHRLAQIAMDGSQKLPQRHLQTIRANLQAGRPTTSLVLGVAGFLIHASGLDLAGEPVQVNDPMGAVLAERLACLRSDTPQALTEVLKVGAIFGDDLATHPRFRELLLACTTSLLRDGARGALAKLV